MSVVLKQSADLFDENILETAGHVLLVLPPETVVRTGHGDNTTIGAEQETLAKISQ